jgi:hypothetical protein
MKLDPFPTRWTPLHIHKWKVHTDVVGFHINNAKDQVVVPLNLQKLKGGDI